MINLGQVIEARSVLGEQVGLPGVDAPTLKDVIMFSLRAIHPGTDPQDVMQDANHVLDRYWLSKKIEKADGEVELSQKEIAILEKQFKKHFFHPELLGKSLEALHKNEPQEEIEAVPV